jgi:hypothetical protein
MPVSGRVSVGVEAMSGLKGPKRRDKQAAMDQSFGSRQ